MRTLRSLRLAFAALFFAVISTGTAVAHEVPNAVSLHAFVKPQGERVHMLIRLPLGLLGTLELPRRGPGYIDLARAEQHLQLAATLAAKEFQLLEHFLLNAGTVISRAQLLEKVWDMHFDPGSNVVDVHVTRLRKKLDAAGADAKIAAKRGVGFVLQAP